MVSWKSDYYILLLVQVISNVGSIILNSLSNWKLLCLVHARQKDEILEDNILLLFVDCELCLKTSWVIAHPLSSVGDTVKYLQTYSLWLQFSVNKSKNRSLKNQPAEPYFLKYILLDSPFHTIWPQGHDVRLNSLHWIAHIPVVWWTVCRLKMP